MESFEFSTVPRRQYSIKEINDDYTVSPSNEFVSVDTQTSPIAIELPIQIGMTVVIKDVTGNAGTNNITITPISGLIDGASSVVISNNYNSLSLFCDGINWSIF